MRAVTLLLAGILAAGVLLAGCTVTGTVCARRQDRQDVPVTSTPIVVVDTFNGRMPPSRRGRSRWRCGSTITVARAATRRRPTATSVEVDIAQVGDRVTITARRRDGQVATGDSGADVELYVPPDARLELRTSNARVEATNVTGPVLARTSNGSPPAAATTWTSTPATARCRSTAPPGTWWSGRATARSTSTTRAMCQ
ncbi:MAG: hypothetical protein U0667_06345 [Chloroflexota bacterium]